MRHPFSNRSEAGHLLARHLAKEIAGPNLLVVALPRGGVVVGNEVSSYLEVPLEILIVRKIGAPHQPELALGAVASTGEKYLNQRLISQLKVSEEEINSVVVRESAEVLRREKIYGKSVGIPELSGKKVLIVDDGIATGATVKVAIQALRKGEPSYLALAVPVASLNSIESLSRLVDRCFVLQTPEEFDAVGDFYESFPPVSDDEVVSLLKEARARLHHGIRHDDKTRSIDST